MLALSLKLAHQSEFTEGGQNYSETVIDRKMPPSDFLLSHRWGRTTGQTGLLRHLTRALRACAPYRGEIAGAGRRQQPWKHTHMNASSSWDKRKYDYQHKRVCENKLFLLWEGLESRQEKLGEYTHTHVFSRGRQLVLTFFSTLLSLSYTSTKSLKVVFFFNVKWLPASNGSNMSENTRTTTTKYLPAVWTVGSDTGYICAHSILWRQKPEWKGQTIKQRPVFAGTDTKQEMLHCCFAVWVFLWLFSQVLLK